MSDDPMAEEPTVRVSLAADRISNLPSNVTNNILKHLSLTDAVRTSMLSRYWRYKWVTLPDLRFNSMSGEWEPEPIIDHILLRHKGPIAKFSVRGIDVKNTHAVICWLHFLTNHEIEYLELHMCKMTTETDDNLLPSHLFLLNHLKHLHLHNFKMMLPPAFEGFSKLVNLNLKFVNIKFTELKIILSKCPMLEFLCMFRCVDISDTSPWLLDIDAPNLKSFHFDGYFSSICFQNASLEEISFGYSLRSENFELCGSCGSESNAVKLFSQLPSIKKVCIGDLYDPVEFLAIGGVPEKLPNDLNHLTHLDFGEIDLSLMDHVTCVICLVRSSPNLHTFKINFEYYADEREMEWEPVIEYLKEQQMSNVHLSCAKIVDIYGISGFDAELEVVKLLLLWATTLEKLVIHPYFKGASADDTEVRDDYKTMVGVHKLIKEIVSFRRASSKAVIIFPHFDDVM